MQQRILVERWWNGTFGRLARRDVWLWRVESGVWVVEIRAGGAESRQHAEWSYPSEAAARDQLRRCIDTGPGAWRELPRS